MSYQEIDEKALLVKNIFSKIAQKYDLMNDILSFGLHRFWRRKACKSLLLNISKNIDESQKEIKILDLACGTGVMSFMLEKLSKKFFPNKTIKIIGVDFSPEMLKIAEIKKITKNSLVEFQKADALNLYFEDQVFDGVMLAYGLRNVSNYKRCLEEIKRVCKSKGVLLILDFIHSNMLFENILNFYKVKIIPQLGHLLTKNRQAYEYLSTSIKDYLNQEELALLLKETAWQNIQYKNLLGGISCIHRSIK